jgi:nitrite reductase/ring-hydroxylating ferredoxin subunit
MPSMTAPREWRCAAADLVPGRTAKFRLTCHGRPVEGFLVNHEGSYHAYVNRCAHVGTPLDLWPNEFLTEDGQIICSTHGAIYAPDTGRCTAGPCVGDALERLDLRQEGAVVVVSCGRAR